LGFFLLKYDCRIIFNFESNPETQEEEINLIDIGTHDAGLLNMIFDYVSKVSGVGASLFDDGEGRSMYNPKILW
jgi:hypothetical protein